MNNLPIFFRMDCLHGTGVTRTTRTPAFWDTPCHPMITHTSDSHQIPNQKKTKSKLQIKKNAKNSNFEIFQRTLHSTHLLMLLDKMYKYEMDPTRTVGATERTWNAGRTDGRMEGRTDGQSETNIPPNNFVVRGYNNLITPVPVKLPWRIWVNFYRLR